MSDHPTQLPRREFLQLLGLGAAAALSPKLVFGDVNQTPQSTWNDLVPADKQLEPAWLKSLTERGSPTIYTKPDLKFIGMPIGGFFAGQLYLGGDGKLWLWDIFNSVHSTADEHYAKPQEATSPVDCFFSLGLESFNATGGQKSISPLNAQGFEDVTFRGEYPIGTVSYRDKDFPVTTTLEAFSPFCPLDADFSSLPATLLRFTVTNPSDQPAHLTLFGCLENKICIESLQLVGGQRRNELVRTGDMLAVKYSAQATESKEEAARPAIVFADFEGDTFAAWTIAAWTVEGEAFGSGPTTGASDPEQHLTNFQGKRLANSRALKSDKPTGKLTSPQFTIARRYINFLIGGGNHPGRTCINLMIDGEIVKTSTGFNTDQMDWASWPVHELAGKTAHLEMIDTHAGDWGHIEIDQIEFSDESRANHGKLIDQPDFGSMCLALLDPPATAEGSANDILAMPHHPTLLPNEQANLENHGSIACKFTIEPGASQTLTFAITWHFSNLTFPTTRWDAGQKISPSDVIEKGRHYATRFESALHVAEHLAKNHEQLYQQTKLWRDTWYDSTLPYWFLDRTIANISTLATNTSYRFANGRYWGFEGVGSCRGTCTHVYGYEQSVGRLFPELDRLLRERTDFGVGFNPNTGAIGMRGEKSGPAVDGTCMIILRTLRDHQTSADDSFLKTNWPKIKLAIEWLMSQDKNGDGILTGPQANTLDAEWFGAVPWISGLYLAALRAFEELADALFDQKEIEPDGLGDAAENTATRKLLEKVRTFREAGHKNFAPKMFNGEYFVQLPDEKHLKAVGSFDGCEIDQVLGQSWAWQVGLGRVLPEKETKSALAALWKYNFAKDVGPFRGKYKPGRWFAMPGETGTLMCSWPRGESHRVSTGFDFYFNECMNGFEHQLAGHMIWEGMVTEGLAIERAVHDRYHASKRNPWNEIECGDHYARSMASFGVFLAACGFEFNGPAGYLAFAPRISPENFRAPFVTAEGWGTFSQTLDGQTMKVTLALKYGRLKLSSLALVLLEKVQPKTVVVTLSGTAKGATLNTEGREARVVFHTGASLEKGEKLEISIG